MKSFLEYVAKDIICRHGNNLSKVAVIFPNKRASIFMNEYLVAHSDKPVWSPSYITISDLFRKHSNLTVPDQIKLICDLHKCFVECTGVDESLDHFYGWGQLMLADFDDIDKNMADARQVFANMKDIHAYDDIDYLTDEQKLILKRFFANFTDDKNTELKQRFINIWSKFHDIYQSFNDQLRKNGYAYEGALYREVANDDSICFDYEKYIFVGFNMIQQVEQKLFERLKRENKAEFYWDFDSYYVDGRNGNQHEAGHYIKENLRMFPCSMEIENDEVYNNFKNKKSVTFISATTEDIQARYAGEWLKEDNRAQQGKKTAVVMCNEGLMQTVLHSLPEDCGAVNITTGYPLQQTPVASLLRLLVALRCDGFNRNRNRFILQYVNRLLNHPYISYLSDNYSILLNEINNIQKVYYPSAEQLAKDECLELLFSNPDEGSKHGISFEMALTEWLLKILRLLAEKTESIDEPLFKESLFRTYTLINRLSSLIECGDLNVNYLTLQSLVNQLIQSTSIPFHGEPAEGIQIMGLLETRNLDFDNILLLSCNEGFMPKGVNDNSFIPYSIRKAFGLTTVDNKVAIYAYYFYRLIQRAKNVTIVYSNATNDGNKCEMSRFLIQLLVESGHDIKHKVFTVGLEQNKSEIKGIEKSDMIMRMLINRFDKEKSESRMPRLTPTAINLYQRCPLRFYYNYVCGIKEPDFNDEETIDGRIFGNIFHMASQLIYTKLQDNEGWIKPTYIEKLLKTRIEIERAVDEAFRKELFNMPNGTKLEYNGLQLINREVIIIYLCRLLENDMRLGNFKIIGLEKVVGEEMSIESSEGSFSTVIGGFIDRLDMISSAQGDMIRVIDYKTGKYKLEKITDINEMFQPKSISKHSDYFIQTMLYSKIVSDSHNLNPEGLPVCPSLLFIQQSIENSEDIILQLNNEKIMDIKKWQPEFMEMLKGVIKEIFDKNIPFKPTESTERCSFCPYSAICKL